MKTLVVFLVDNGESTDGLADWIDKARGVGVIDYDLQVDIDVNEEFTLDYTGETVYLRRHPGSPSAAAFRELERERVGVTVIDPTPCPDCGSTTTDHHYLDCSSWSFNN